MRVARLYKPKDIRLENEEKPKLVDGQLLTRIKSVGVCGSDVHWYRDGHIGSLALSDPLILGHEIAAEVVEIGKGVEGFEVGMTVVLEPGVPCGKCVHCQQGNYNVCPDMHFCGTPPTDGAYREYMLYSPRWAYPLPHTISSEEGALLETLAVGLNAVDLSHIKVGKTAAIFGVGSIGLCTLQMAKLAGALDIIAVDPLEYRLEKAKHYGATATINPTKHDPIEEIMKLTGKKGVDITFEAAGAMETPQQCAAVTRPAGRVVLIGICPEDKIMINASNARRKGLSIMLVRRMRHTYQRSIALLDRGVTDLKGLITHRFKLEDIKKAFEMVDVYGDKVIKAVINI